MPLCEIVRGVVTDLVQYGIASFAQKNTPMDAASLGARNFVNLARFGNADECGQSLAAEGGAETADLPGGIEVEGRLKELVVILVQNDPKRHVPIQPGTGALDLGNLDGEPVGTRPLAGDRQQKEVGAPVLTCHRGYKRGRTRLSTVLTPGVMFALPEIFVGPNVALLRTCHGQTPFWLSL